MQEVRKIRKVPEQHRDSDGWRRAETDNRGRRDALAGAVVAARLCPFCLHRVALLSYGAYGPELVKCPQCGEVVAFPAVVVGSSDDAAGGLISRGPDPAKP